MKKIIISILAISFVLTSCTAQQTPQPDENIVQGTEPVHCTYIKAVWFTYYELEGLMSDNEQNFLQNIKAAFETIKSMGFNTAVVQVHPCADAFYKSQYFPTSKYCTGTQGVQLTFDPLAVMCNVAREYELRIEAWINPYRVSQDGDIDALCDTNIAKIWYNDSKTKSFVCVLDDGIYFNPAEKSVNDLVVNGVCEIVANYDIDAIHFDDYFYPTTDKSIDEKQYKKYKKNGGDLSRGNWRRENISNMVSSVYSAVKSIKPEVLFGISPASNIENDYSTLYADVERWVSSDGYVDYICPQIYFGFKNVYQPFMFTTKKWVGITTNCKLYVGLPLYKCGKPDKYAAEKEKAIINEFIDNSNIISRQITYLTKIDEISGYFVFSYSNLLDNSIAEEVENMKSVMQSNSPL